MVISPYSAFRLAGKCTGTRRRWVGGLEACRSCFAALEMQRLPLSCTSRARIRPLAAINGCGKFSVVLDFHYQVRDRDFAISDVVIDLSNAQMLAGLI